MIISISVIIFSFIFEGLTSNIAPINSNLLTLFTLISLIIIYPYLYNNHNLYYKICFITGLLYDIAYTNTLFLNALIFILIGYIILKINIFITNSVINVIPISCIIIIVYRTFTYLILIAVGYLNFSVLNIINSIISSLIINIIYIMFIYYITDLIANKKHIDKMN